MQRTIRRFSPHLPDDPGAGIDRRGIRELAIELGERRPAAGELVFRACAVANSRRFRIGFGLERHVTAVTASIDFHDTRPLRCLVFAEDHRLA